MIIEQVQEQHIEGEECPWILARPRITTIKKEDPNTSIVTSMGTWQKNVKRRKRRTQENVLVVKIGSYCKGLQRETANEDKKYPRRFR